MAKIVATNPVVPDQVDISRMLFGELERRVRSHAYICPGQVFLSRCGSTTAFFHRKLQGITRWQTSASLHAGRDATNLIERGD
jgi:hypothetical protein